jgi:hypothetical protein
MEIAISFPNVFLLRCSPRSRHARPPRSSTDKADDKRSLAILFRHVTDDRNFRCAFILLTATRIFDTNNHGLFVSSGTSMKTIFMRFTMSHV